MTSSPTGLPTPEGAGSVSGAPNLPEGFTGTFMLRAGLREPEQVLSDTQVRDLLDLNQPVGIMFMCVLHCLWDQEDPWGVVGQFRDAVAPGSYLALSHVTGEAHPEAAAGLFRMTQDLHWDTPLISRDRTAIARFFDGLTLDEPGLVAPAQWRPGLDNPLRDRRDPGDDGERVFKLPSPGRPPAIAGSAGTCAESASRTGPDDSSLAVGIKNQPDDSSLPAAEAGAPWQRAGQPGANHPAMRSTRRSGLAN